MKIVPLDFETFWSQTHTLKKMSPIEYVMHPETELISCSMKYGNAPARCAFGEADIRAMLAEVDWSDAMAVGHNMSVFDALIMAWRLGIRPLMWGCTLAMARPLHAKTVGLSLAALVQHYGIGVKNAQVLADTRGKHLADFEIEDLLRMQVYNCEDTEQCGQLLHILKRHYTAAELWHIDANIRMLVEPEFELDTELLQDALQRERDQKHQALVTLGNMLGLQDNVFMADEVKKRMASAPKFSAVLQAQGIEVPMKRSKTDPRKLIPAIAKTDEPMVALLDHDNEVVAAAARARLATKSTQLETRIQSFLATYQTLGKLPVPAHYCGADTTGRDSGFLYNMYNLPRINRKKPRISDALRGSVRAPAGKKIVAADSSGIELRVNHTLWQVARSMSLWSADPQADLYIGTASDYYGEEVTKEDPRRQFGKVLELSCGFGIGAAKLRDQARAQYGLRLTPEEALAGVGAWRARYPEITSKDAQSPGGWVRCQNALEDIRTGREVAIDPWGLCGTEQDAIVLPSGRRIRYPDLRQEWGEKFREVDGQLEVKRERSWVYAHGRHKAYLYGGKCTENIVQALARDIIFEQSIEFFKRTGLRPKHKVYDELVYLVDDSVAEELLEELLQVMRTPPKWWPQIVLWSEGAVADCYGDAK